MKRTVIGLLSGILFLTACGGTPTQIQPTSVPLTDTATPSPTSTQTSLPSETPKASVTPLPTIPTFTPTFDVSTILTVTSAPKAECPKENPNITPDFVLPDLAKCNATGNIDYCYPQNTANNILDFLNSGGSIQSVIRRLKKATDQYAYQDVTGDSINEFMFVDFRAFRGFNIFVCKMGHYELLQPAADPPVNLQFIEDMNSNDIPEIILSGGECTGSGCFGVYTYEWNGNTFVNLSPQAGIFGLKNFEITDIDKSGTKEILLTGNLISTFYFEYYTRAPWRDEIHTYMWNGNLFLEQPVEYVSPEYRFQAIQDGDRSILNGKYEEALAFYQDAIFNNKLEWFSRERKKYIETLGGVYGKDVTPQPLIPDSTEYPRLSAYAYYRIMLLHLVQNHESDANTVYNTLQQKFGNDPYAHPYVEMAIEFWEAYQSPHKMYDGCAVAIDYAVKHPEILTPLGSDYHGAQSHTYVSEDVCPFR